MILIFGDLVASGFALVAALYFWGERDNWLDFSWAFLRQRPQFWFYCLPLIWIILLTELYDIRRAGRRKDILQGIIIATTASLGAYLMIFFLSPRGSLPRFSVAVFVLVAALLTLIWRSVYIRTLTTPQFMKRVLIVGAGRAGSTLVKKVHEIRPLPFHLVGLVDDDPQKLGTDIDQCCVLGATKDLLRIVEEQNVSDLVFAISGDMRSELFQALVTAEEQGIPVTTLPAVYEDLLGRVPIFLLQSEWILRSFVDQVHAGELYELLKRVVDILGGSVGCLLLAVLFPLIAVLIVVDNGFPIFYTQKRMGKSGNIYNMIKFRTMCRDAEYDGKPRPAVENDDRVTRIGKILRKSHLDELPQFVNILRGDMSLVGPRAERPELVEDLQEKVPFYRARLLVKPGLTGWAQVNFGYATTDEEMGIKLEFDLFYIKHRTLMLDFVIILRTVGTVIGLRGL